MSAERANANFCGTALSRPAICCIGAAIPPASLANNSSRGAIFESATISSVVRSLPSSIPPLITRFSLSFEKFAKALATETGSPSLPSGRVPVNAIAVGPTRSSSISRSSSFAANRTREFLYTLYSPPASLIAFRRTARSVTLSPRYSVNTTASELWNFSRTSATIATFSAFGSPIGDPFLVKNKMERCRSANAPVSQIVYLVRQRFLFLNHLL